MQIILYIFLFKGIKQFEIVMAVEQLIIVVNVHDHDSLMAAINLLGISDRAQKHKQ